MDRLLLTKLFSRCITLTPRFPRQLQRVQNRVAQKAAEKFE
jgi:hypothetical protein